VYAEGNHYCTITHSTVHGKDLFLPK
jgi:hypothetical protein